MCLVTAEMATNNITGLKPILCLFLEALWLLFTDKPLAKKIHQINFLLQFLPIQ